ncbi:glutathione transferase [Burkholderiaceae bacterium DAT-1]|nr:glutathione transferase [Burkholderiaceae bacterium DAT-1]
MMQLYVDNHYLSPYAMTVYVALTEKQQPFALKTVDLATGAQHADDYAGRVMTRRVPALFDGDFVLSESNAICEYLEDRFPHPHVYPIDVRDKARARQVQAWLRSDLMPIRSERPTEAVFLGQKFAPLTDAGVHARDKLVAACKSLIRPGADHLFGDWCIADSDLALMIQRLALHGDDLPDFMRHYAEYQWRRPSVQAWVGMGR